MPSRAWVVTGKSERTLASIHVSMPSRAWVVTPYKCSWSGIRIVSMPSRAWVVTPMMVLQSSRQKSSQCPHGLIPHFYIDGKKIILFPGAMLCQCPLGLIPHFYNRTYSISESEAYSVNALSGLYLISTVPLQKSRFYAVSRACFCRYLSEYSDNSRFSCMLTFWTYLMRCTYPWHWI